MTQRLAFQLAAIAAIIVVAMHLGGYPNEAWLVSVAVMVSALAYRLIVDSGSRVLSKLVGILVVFGGVAVLYGLRQAGYETAVSLVNNVLLIFFGIMMFNRRLNEPKQP